MAARARRSGGWLLGIGLLLVGAAGWFLWGQTDSLPSGLSVDPDGEDPAASAALRTAEGAAEPGGQSGGPSLVGHTADPDAPVRHGVVTVLVRGAGGRPLAGMQVERVSASVVERVGVLIEQSAVTDGHGEVVFADVPLDGSFAARVCTLATSVSLHNNGDGGLSFVHEGQAVPEAWTILRGARGTIDVPGGIPLRIVPMHAGGGTADALAIRNPAPVFTGAPTLALRTDRDEPLLSLAAGHSYGVTYELGEPARRRDHRGRLHPQATRLVAHEPVREDARIVVLVEGVPAEYQGQPIRWSSRRNAEGWLPARVSADASDRHHVAGITHYVGEAIHIAGALGPHSIRGAGILPARADETLLIRATFQRAEVGIKPRLDARPKIPESGAWASGLTLNPIVVSGQGGYVTTQIDGKHVAFFASGDLALARNLVVTGKLASLDDVRSALKDRSTPPGGTPKPRPVYRVRCFLPNGEPARGAHVMISGQGAATVHADAAGVARFEGLAPGRRVAVVWGAGALRHVAFDLPADGRGTLDVRGTCGGTLDVEVVDSERRPLPFATLSIQQQLPFAWADVDCSAPKGADVVQRIDPYVDADGRRRCHGVQPGDVTLTAKFGTRSATQRVKVLEGRTVAVKIVLPVLTLKPDAETKPKPAQVVGPKNADGR